MKTYIVSLRIICHRLFFENSLKCSNKINICITDKNNSYFCNKPDTFTCIILTFFELWALSPSAILCTNFSDFKLNRITK